MSELELSFDLEGSIASTGFSGRKFDRLRIEKDQTVFVRIMPPFGEGSNRMLFHKYAIHWGFTTEDGGKRPISCSYPTERYCPVCEGVKEAKNELESYKDKKTGKYTGGSSERVDELTAYIRTFDVNNFFALNAVTFDGRIVILELKKMAVDNLLARINEAVKVKKFDPISLDKGVWFAISREGEKLKTKYPVDFKKIVKKTADGEDAEVRDHSPMAPELVLEIKKQLAEGGMSPLYDTHTLHEPCTAKELKGYMDGDPLPGRAKKVEEPEVTNAGSGEEPGDAPDVSYDTSTSDPEPQAEVEKPAPKAVLTKPAGKLTGAGPTKPATTLNRPPVANAAAEIARLRQMASIKSGAAKANG
jgi:hypothetical protein